MRIFSLLCISYVDPSTSVVFYLRLASTSEQSCFYARTKLCSIIWSRTEMSPSFLFADMQMILVCKVVLLCVYPILSSDLRVVFFLKHGM